MGNTLSPLSGNDFPIIYSNDSKGGHHQVADISSRDAIPMIRRQLGMLCTVLDDGSGFAKTYQLVAGIANLNWIEYKASGGVGNQQLYYNSTTHILTLENGGIIDLTGIINEDNQLLSYNGSTNELLLENGGSVDLSNDLNEVDPKWTSESGNYYTKTELETPNSANVPFINFTHIPQTLSELGIFDAMTSSHPANQITVAQISNWNAAYNWGDHTQSNYLSKDLPSGNILIGDDWNTATWNSISGDATIDNTGVLTLSNNVTTDKFAEKAISGKKIGLPGQSAGDMIFFDGTNWVVLPKGSNGQILKVVNGLPEWKDLSNSMAVLSTSDITDINENSVVTGGNITDDCSSEITERGICYSTSPVPTINDNKISSGSGLGSFTVTLTGLTECTKYYVRAYAVNSFATSYGNTNSVVPYNSNIVKDCDGNIYTSVELGTQTWTLENMKTTRYNDGTPIPLVTDDIEWQYMTNPGYCWYNNDESTYKATYGALYNFYTVETDKICPSGWHVPTDVEWSILVNFLSENFLEFSAIYGGVRMWGTFENVDNYGWYWSSSPIDYKPWEPSILPETHGYVWMDGISKKPWPKHIGTNIRCIKN
jgi:hypothetical protein